MVNNNWYGEKFDHPVTLKKGKLYRICVTKEEDTNLAEEYVWTAYGESSANMRGPATVQNGVGQFKSCVVAYSKGKFPTALKSNSKGKCISIGFMVNKKALDARGVVYINELISPGAND